MAGKDSDTAALQRRLERLSASLRTSTAPSAPSAKKNAPAEQVGEGRLALRGFGIGGASIGIALIAVAIATGTLALLIPGGLLLLAGATLALLGFSKPDPAELSRPRIGAGAEIAADAVIEPGATVEMGATIGAGARICRGAIVRMGATVEAGAVIQEDAIVGWGVDVKENAIVERGARIAAGATVNPGAVVPAGMRLPPGSDWSGKSSGTAPAAKSAPVEDPRLARIDSACERIAAELEQAPETVRHFLGASAETAVALRRVCVGLVAREKVLRAESSEQALAALEQERAAIEQRIAAATDDRIRASLKSAAAAIDDQKKQRTALKVNADRLDAELTRLQWTLDGIAAQMVRLRTAGSEVTAGTSTEIVQTVQQLHDEIDAIAEALEDVSGAPRGMEPIAEISSSADAGARTPDRERSR